MIGDSVAPSDQRERESFVGSAMQPPSAGRSIRNVLLWLVGIPMFALLAVLAYDSYRQYQDDIDAANRSAAAIAQATAQQSEMFIRRAEKILSELARRPAVRALDPARCDPLLADLLHMQPAYANLLTLDAAGKLVCSAAGIAPESADRPDPKYYFTEVMRTRKFTLGTPAKGFLTGRWVSTFAYPLLDAGGRPVGVVAIAVDLAAHRPAHNEYLQPGTLVSILNGQGALIARSEDAAHRVGTIVDNEAVRIMLKRRQGTARASGHLDQDRFFAFTPIKHSDWIAVVSMQADAVLAHARRLALQRLALALALVIMITALAYWIAQRIAKPIITISKTIAAVHTGDARARAPLQGPREIRQIARELNAMLDARIRDEEALRESRKRLRLFIQFAPSAIAMVDREMRYVAYSRRWLVDYGLGEQDLIGRSHYEVFPEIPERWKEIHRRCLAGATETCDEDPFPRADGHMDWVRWEVRPWYAARDKVEGIIMFSEVITPRVRAEQDLEYKNIVLATQQEASPDAILVVDENSTIVSHNRKFLEMWRIPETLANAAVDEPVLQLVVSQVRDPEAFLAKVRHLYAHPEEESDDQFHLNDGRIIERHSAPAVGANGRYVGRVWYFRDITARSLADTALRESEERFRAMIEQSISGTCIIEDDGRLAYVNPRLAAILGYDSHKELVGHPALKIVAPESRHLVQENLRQRMSGEPRAGRYTFEAIRKDGSHITLGAHGNAGTYRGKKVLITTVQDVTEISRAEREVRNTIAKLERAVQSTIMVISTIGELRDAYTHGHERRVGEIAAAIATEMGLAAMTIEGVKVAGYLHDVGKLAIPAEILSKPGRLSMLEFDLVRQHAQQGYQILKDLPFDWPVAQATLQHHERLDGSGYPQGLKDDQIIIEARILAIADTIEAMASHRPYRPGLGLDIALAEIERGRGLQYDAAAVDACLRLFRDKAYKIPA